MTVVHEPLAVTVLSGLDRLAVDDLVTSLLLREDRLAVVHADPSTVERGELIVHVHHAVGDTSSRRYPLDHACVSCTLRGALVRELGALAEADRHDAVVVQLHPGLDADTLLRGLHENLPHSVRLDTHVAVLPVDWLAILAGGTSLLDHDAGIGTDDERFTATVLCASIETASTVVLADSSRRDVDVLADEAAVLDLIAPAAVRLRVRHVASAPEADIVRTGRFDPARLDPLDRYGIRDPHRHLAATRTLTLVRWTAERPLHPRRLHAALDELADGVIRSSGRLDIADQPDAVVGWDSVGESLLLGPIAPWAAVPGRRRSTLTLLGDRLDAVHIRCVLDRCVLTDAELSMIAPA